MSASIMAEIVAYSKCRGSAQHLLVIVGYYANADGTGAYPSLQTLADRSGLTERHIQRLIKTLEADGYLHVTRSKEPGTRPRNMYTILRPWYIPAQMNTDTCEAVPAQMNTDMFTDMFTDTMSVDPLKDPEEKKPCAHTPEERDKHERRLAWLGYTSGSEPWKAAMNGYLQPLATLESE